MTDALLSIKNLTIENIDKKSSIQLVSNISFDMHNEILGIVGESGSGKSIIVRAILGILPNNLKIHADKLYFRDLNLLNNNLTKSIRGRRIGMIFQDPKYSLNPLFTSGYQISEMFRLHKKLNKKISHIKTIQLLSKLKFDDPFRAYSSFPHELSGGMAQRIFIAMMLAPDPELLIADEPTSSLDKDSETEIISLLKQSVIERGMSLIFISHDIELISQICHRVIIIRHGKIVEISSINELFNSKLEYTQNLIKCMLSTKLFLSNKKSCSLHDKN